MGREVKKDNRFVEVITVLFGLCIVIGRVLVPSYFEITKKVVLFELLLEIAICFIIIYLNRDKIKIILRNGKNDKLTKFIKKSLFVFLCMMGGSMFFGIVVRNLLKFDVVLAGIGNDFANVFLIPTLISQIIVAPITEELVFRMTLKDLISNKILFVIISGILFAFIHDFFFFSGGIVLYFVVGVVTNLTYLKVKDVRYMIGGHMLNNAVANFFQFISKISF